MIKRKKLLLIIFFVSLFIFATNIIHSFSYKYYLDWREWKKLDVPCVKQGYDTKFCRCVAKIITRRHDAYYEKYPKRIGIYVSTLKDIFVDGLIESKSSCSNIPQSFLKFKKVYGVLNSESSGNKNLFDG